MLQFIALLRPLNLIIIAVIMYVLRYFVLGRAITQDDSGAGFDFEFQFSSLDFFLLVLSTVLLAGAGNIINDYFDMRADRINKPEKVIVGRTVKRRVAMFAHFVFNGMALLISIYLVYRVGIYSLIAIPLFAAGSLWFYSTQFKRRFFIGNFIIALLAALVPAQVALYDLPMLLKTYQAEIAETMIANGFGPNMYIFSLAAVCFIYAGFAFITTLIRELQKDMADHKGDKAVGCKTVPIVLGHSTTKIVVTLLILITIAGTYYFTSNTFFSTSSEMFLYVSGAVIVPLCASAFFMWKASNRKQHLIASQIIKLAMIGAILLPVFFNFFQ